MSDSPPRSATKSTVKTVPDAKITPGMNSANPAMPTAGASARLLRRLLSSWLPIETVLASARFWWSISLALAATLAWASRHSMNPDGISYLDMASEAADGSLAKLINPYWSPAYPALLSAALFLFNPSPDQEFPLIHFVNFLLFAFALLAFSLFLRHWRPMRTGHFAAGGGNHIDHLIPFAYCTFLWFMLTGIGLQFVTPDLGVAGSVLLAAAVCCRVSLPEARTRDYVALGLALAAGYYFKAAMFPLSLALLAILFIFPPRVGRESRPRILLSLLVFLISSTPLIAALSLRLQRPTFGEVGRLNYAWYVNGLRWKSGSILETNRTTTDHPARKLLQKPLTFEFQSPLSGTYPVWYDPSYWYANTRVRFNLRQQAEAIIQTLRTYEAIAFESAPFISGVIVLCIIALHDRRSLAPPRVLWWQILWPLAAFSMYALVYVEKRFLGAFLVLFCLATYRVLVAGLDRRVMAAVFAMVIFTAMASLLRETAKQGAAAVGGLAARRQPEYQTIAAALTDFGLRRGDHIAVVGPAHDCSYARRNRLRIMAQIPDAEEFWRLDNAEREAAARQLASVGVKALVAFNRPDHTPAGHWKERVVSDTRRLSVLLLDRQ